MLSEEDIERLKEQSRHTMMDHLGIRLLPSDNECSIKAEMPVDHRTCQPYGYLNGGASLALAENLAGLGSCHLCQEGEIPLGIQVSANHVSAVTVGYTVVAEATLLHRGSSTHVWNVDIRRASGALVSSVRVVNAIRKRPVRKTLSEEEKIERKP